MADELLDDAQCSICLEILHPPIRMLTCGHNFCGTCLQDLFNSNRLELCPNCRTSISLQSCKSVENLPRNFMLEKMIENIKKMKIDFKENSRVSSQPAQSDIFESLKDLARSYMSDGLYEEAYSTLQSILVQEKSSDKVLLMIDQALCQLEIGQENGALSTSVQIANLIESYANSSTFKTIVERCDAKLQRLVIKLAGSGNPDTAFTLCKCRFSLMKYYYANEKKLSKCENIAESMQSVIAASVKQKKQNFQEEFKLMDEIFNQMQAINIVDLEIKCRDVVWFLKYYGFCCNQVNDVTKSAEVNKEAIVLMEFVFATDANYHSVLGHCYNNLGATYEIRNLFMDAKRSYEKATAIYTKARDWSNKEEKSANIALSTQNFDRVCTKSDYNKTKSNYINCTI